jgi:hypothetical protein
LSFFGWRFRMSYYSDGSPTLQFAAVKADVGAKWKSIVRNYVAAIRLFPFSAGTLRRRADLTARLALLRGLRTG